MALLEYFYFSRLSGGMPSLDLRFLGFSDSDSGLIVAKVALLLVPAGVIAIFALAARRVRSLADRLKTVPRIFACCRSQTGR
ncbi:hypothetical protein [Mesorhizobium sp. ANAO-SY3R2]|uniref:hypothetical protein n=1 Tax=Mesorhizobium sp. ANAO-SY3R2 TaxID=3166644 RepID=UPI00366F73FA